jgi:hypothetical protein
VKVSFNPFPTKEIAIADTKDKNKNATISRKVERSFYLG